MYRVPNTGEERPISSSTPWLSAPRGRCQNNYCCFSWGKPGLNTAPQGAQLRSGTAAVNSFLSKLKFILVMADCALLRLPKAWWPGWNNRLALLQMPVTKHDHHQNHSWQAQCLPSGASQQSGWGKSRAQQPAPGSRHMPNAHAAVPCTTSAVLTTSILVPQVYQARSELLLSNSVHWRGASVAAVLPNAAWKYSQHTFGPHCVLSAACTTGTAAWEEKWLGGSEQRDCPAASVRGVLEQRLLTSPEAQTTRRQETTWSLGISYVCCKNIACILYAAWIFRFLKWVFVHCKCV